jgi:CRISPR-associated protein Cas2
MSGPTSRYLVTYDIENDRVRSRVSTVLESTGWRVQKSVFECVVDADGLEMLTRRLTRELARGPGGNVRVYRLCASCLQASYGLEEVVPGAGGEPWVVA